jgi:general secretion pathway protein A
MINLLCDRTLLGTYVQGKSMVDLPTLNKAAREVFGEPGDRRQMKKKLSWAIIFLLLIVCGTALAATYFGGKLKLFEVNKTEPPQMNVSQRPADLPLAREQEMNLLQWPADLPLDRDQTMAFQALFKQWEIPYKNEGDVCQQAEAQGLRCMEELGNLSSIMKLNRPAVLKLIDDQGKEFYVTLAMIKGRTATIEVGDERRTVDLKELEHRWLGKYTLLWRVPSNYRGDIHPGMRGPDVHWLDTQLAIIQGRKARTGEVLTYDAQLITQVKKFQISEEMVPDGIVGPQTIIHLNTAAGIKAPRLVQQQGET